MNINPPEGTDPMGMAEPQVPLTREEYRRAYNLPDPHIPINETREAHTAAQAETPAGQVEAPVGEGVTVDDNGNPTKVPAPKVLAAAVVSGLLVVAVAILGAVTPDLLTFAGQWSVVLYAGIVALAGFLAGYIKKP